MRATSRLLAAVSRTIQPHAPTGIAGLRNHPAPRSALIYYYTRTLSKLKEMPEASAYRKATESMTTKRLATVQAVKPAGYEAWLEKLKALQADKDLQGFYGKDPKEAATLAHLYNLKFRKYIPEAAYDDLEWYDGEDEQGGVDFKWEMEPPLTADQVEEIEQKIGAGLVEEVLQVAVGELKLANTVLESKPWEDLVEKPIAGQWKYFER